MSEKVKIKYKNHRGEVSWRKINPVHFYFGSTKWHPEKQWMLEAYDFDKFNVRHFAMKDIIEWRADD